MKSIDKDWPSRREFGMLFLPDLRGSDSTVYDLDPGTQVEQLILEPLHVCPVVRDGLGERLRVIFRPVGIIQAVYVLAVVYSLLQTEQRHHLHGI